MVCDNKAMTQVVSSTDVVARGYDQMAAAYLAERAALKSGKYVQKLLTLLPKRAQILDLGCGAGVPVDDLFLKKGHQVTGIDISPVMIARARRACPEGDYLVGDIQDLPPGAYQVDAVVSFYALFHLPRARHQQYLTTWLTYLPVGGYLLVTLGDRDFEGMHLLHGAKLWSSQWGVAKNRALLARFNLEILIDEVDVSGGERHHVVLARKTR